MSVRWGRLSVIDVVERPNNMMNYVELQEYLSIVHGYGIGD